MKFSCSLSYPPTRLMRDVFKKRDFWSSQIQILFVRLSPFTLSFNSIKTRVNRRNLHKWNGKRVLIFFCSELFETLQWLIKSNFRQFFFRKGFHFISQIFDLVEISSRRHKTKSYYKKKRTVKPLEISQRNIPIFLRHPISMKTLERENLHKSDKISPLCCAVSIKA